MIVVVSDVHLLGEPWNEEKQNEDDGKFSEFLGYLRDNFMDDGDHLVLLGDFIDLWRGDFVEAMTNNVVIDINSKLRGLMDKNVNIHYVAGNHDYYMLKLNQKRDEFSPIKNVFSKAVKSIRLQDGRKSFFFIHGYQLEVLTWKYYKAIGIYEKAAEEFCLTDAKIGAAASKLWEVWTDRNEEDRKSELLRALNMEADLKALKSELKLVPVMTEDALEMIVKKALEEEPEKGLKMLASDATRIFEANFASMFEPPHTRIVAEAKSSIDRLAESKARNIYLRMGEDDVLVFGHTHEIPYYNRKSEVANTGSWNKNSCNYYSLALIENGEIKLKGFDGGEIRDIPRLPPRFPDPHTTVERRGRSGRNQPPGPGGRRQAN